MSRVFTRLAVLLIVAGVSASTVQADGATASLEFKIKRARIAKALSNFAKQAGVSVARPRLSYRDGKARALSGKFTLEEGLTLLLRGTGYDFEVISKRSIRIFKARLIVAEKSAVPQVNPAPDEPIEEILVSTTRRLDTVQKLPYSISVITGSEQEHLRAVTSNDVIHRMANIYATNRGEGQNKIIIRGMSDGAFTGRAQSLVSVYFDNNRVTYNAPDPSLRLYDVESIEVLRGPQGTLYGSGALGGIYRVVTRKPVMNETEFLATAAYSLTESGASSKEISTVVNIPISNEKASLRWVAYLDDRGGYIDDDRLGRENINNTKTWGGRASTAIRFGERWLLTAGVNLQKHDSGDSQYYNGEKRRLKRDNYLREPRRDRYTQAYATVEADFDWGELVSSTSWMKRSIDHTLDGTRAIEWLVGLDEVIPSPFKVARTIKNITNETHVASAPGSKLEWILGSFYSRRREVSNSYLTVPGAQFITYLEPTDVIYSELFEDEMEEMALFGELTVFLTEKLSITGGLRWFRYDDTARSELVDIGLDVDNVAEGEQKKSGFTPKAVISYQANDGLLFYAQMSEGYRVGGINLAGLTPFVFVDEDGEIIEEPNLLADAVLDNFESDELTNYELGIKSQMWGGKLIANFAAFYARWHKIQSHQFYEGLPDVDNVGDARIYGAEIDLSLHPSGNFELKANASISDSKLTKSDMRFGAAVGDALPGAPKYSAGVSARYEFGVGGSLRGAISADYSYVSGTDLLFQKLVTPRNEAYQLTNVRMALGNGRWQLTAFVNNLFRSRSNVFAYGNSLSLAEFDFFTTTNQYTPLRPRTFGLELSYRY